jgi:D-tyrosyl-tRNA(Tyr) deacylase
MLAVIQRVSEASVEINGEIKGSIQKGCLVLLGISHTDNEEDIDWICKKIANMRIFADKEEKMNLSIKDINGNILLVSQFTLYASTNKGNRPSFMEAARPEVALPLYMKCIATFNDYLGTTIQTGEFGADMKVRLLNDGPVTIILDSKNKI